MADSESWCPRTKRFVPSASLSTNPNVDADLSYGFNAVPFSAMLTIPYGRDRSAREAVGQRVVAAYTGATPDCVEVG